MENVTVEQLIESIEDLDYTRLALYLTKFSPSALIRTDRQNSIGVNMQNIWIALDKNSDTTLLDMWIRACKGYTNVQQRTLTHAAISGKVEYIDIFVENGVELDIARSSGYTPLIIAIVNDHIPFAERLIELGADINKLDVSNRDDYVEEKVELMKEYLREKEYDMAVDISR